MLAENAMRLRWVAEAAAGNIGLVGPVRKRPGMYIGGVDERALHHLFAEVLDNSMDEAVAGFADRIEVELDYSEMILPETATYEFVYPTVVGPRYAGKAAFPRSK